MKRSKILTLLHDKYPKAGDAKTVKVKYWNDLMDDLDELLPSDGTANLDTIAEQTSGSGVTIDGVLLKDGGVSSTSGITEYARIVNLTSANLLAMNGTPVEVVPAYGAGTVVCFKSAILIYDDQGTDYANGGAISINYASGAAQSSTLASTFLSSNGDKVWNLEKLNAANGLTQLVNTGLVITNASAPFITGTGICRLHIFYTVHNTGL